MGYGSEYYCGNTLAITSTPAPISDCMAMFCTGNLTELRWLKTTPDVFFRPLAKEYIVMQDLARVAKGILINLAQFGVE